MSLRSVNYDAAAPVYQEGRAISAPALRRWGAAVEQFLPRGDQIVVLDLGAGTGVFAREWTRWRCCRVVAVEPSAGMRAQAVVVGLPPEVALVAGTAEHLAIRNSSVDVAWLSAVLHHLGDAKRCIEELGRVVTPGGAILVRGFFSDRSEVGWLRFFPGADRARTRFPSAIDTSALFVQCGMDPVGAIEVDDHLKARPKEAASWARRMQEADTLLCAFSEDEFAEGVAALEDSRSDEPLTARLTLLAFTKP
jgi:SAM-dependent methyltransferase